MSLPRVAIIGAGSSGIAATKWLTAAGLEVTTYEISDRIGGNWAFGNPNGMSSAYRGLHINTSRERMAFSDFPMPRTFPDFPHHAQIADYFASYVEHFGLARWIRFQTPVLRATRSPEGLWILTLPGGELAYADALLVANGHHWDPRWPTPAPPGEFDGEVLHAHHYVDSAGYAGRRVCVVGMGNSAMDIAVEASWVAEKVLLSARHGVHVIPKYVLGRPLDQIVVGRVACLPYRWRQAALTATLRLVAGDVTRYGLPRPERPLLESHPTISDAILSRIAHGEITPKPAIERLEGHRIRFVDNSVEEVDVLIYATGYQISFPFFDPEFISAPDNELPLYKRIFHPQIPGVYFIGLVQPLGATMPIAEAQSQLVAEHLCGRYALPETARLRERTRRERAVVARRYGDSPRHTMQIDFDAYLYGLTRERRAGRRRAARAGYPVPVPVAAAALGARPDALSARG